MTSVTSIIGAIALAVALIGVPLATASLDNGNAGTPTTTTQQADNGGTVGGSWSCC